MTERTQMSPARARFLWAAAGAAGFAASVALYRQVFAASPDLWTHSDEWIYRVAGLLVRQHPAELYRVRLGAPGQPRLLFTYPPFAALVFAAFSGLSFAAWQIGLVLLDLALLPVSTYLALRIAGYSKPGPLVALALGVAAIELWLEPVYSTLVLGQINLIVLALILLDWALPDSCRWKGVPTGLATGLMLTPLIFVPYLLLTRRPRVAITMTLTFAATVCLGFALVPAASARYWGGQFAIGPAGVQDVANQSVNGVVQRLFHDQRPAVAVWAVLALALALAGVAVAALASRRGDEFLGVVVCGVTGLLVCPISWTHHWVWVIPALALLVDAARASQRGARVAFLAGAALLVALFLSWPVHVRLGTRTALLPWGLLRLAPHGSKLEYTWRDATWLLGNSYVLAGLIAVVGAGACLLRSSRRRPAVPASAYPGRDRTSTRA